MRLKKFSTAASDAQWKPFVRTEALISKKTSIL